VNPITRCLIFNYSPSISWMQRLSIFVMQPAQRFFNGQDNKVAAASGFEPLHRGLCTYRPTTCDRLIHFPTLAPRTANLFGQTRSCSGKSSTAPTTSGSRETHYREPRAEARRRIHTPMVPQYQWLRSVLREHFAYFGLPSNVAPGLTPSSQRRVVFGIGLSTAEGTAQVGLLRPVA